MRPRKTEPGSCRCREARRWWRPSRWEASPCSCATRTWTSRRFRAPSEELKQQFIGWLGEGRLYDGSQVRDLVDIVSNEEARRALASAGYDAAIGILNGERPERASAVFRAMDRLVEHLRRAPKHEIDALRGGDRAKVARVRELYGALRSFAELAEVRLEE